MAEAGWRRRRRAHSIGTLIFETGNREPDAYAVCSSWCRGWIWRCWVAKGPRVETGMAPNSIDCSLRRFQAQSAKLQNARKKKS